MLLKKTETTGEEERYPATKLAQRREKWAVAKVPSASFTFAITSTSAKNTSNSSKNSMAPARRSHRSTISGPPSTFLHHIPNNFHRVNTNAIAGRQPPQSLSPTAHSHTTAASEPQDCPQPVVTEDVLTEAAKPKHRPVSDYSFSKFLDRYLDPVLAACIDSIVSADVERLSSLLVLPVKTSPSSSVQNGEISSFDPEENFAHRPVSFRSSPLSFARSPDEKQRAFICPVSLSSSPSSSDDRRPPSSLVTKNMRDKAKARINAQVGQAGERLLHCAVACGRWDCVELLLRAGANPLICDHRRLSPLHYCCLYPFYGSAGLSLLMSAQPALLFMADSDGQLPLNYAISASVPENFVPRNDPQPMLAELEHLMNQRMIELLRTTDISLWHSSLFLESPSTSLSETFFPERKSAGWVSRRPSMRILEKTTKPKETNGLHLACCEINIASVGSILSQIGKLKAKPEKERLLFPPPSRSGQKNSPSETKKMERDRTTTWTSVLKPSFSLISPLEFSTAPYHSSESEKILSPQQEEQRLDTSTCWSSFKKPWDTPSPADHFSLSSPETENCHLFSLTGRGRANTTSAWDSWRFKIIRHRRERQRTRLDRELNCSVDGSDALTCLFKSSSNISTSLATEKASTMPVSSSGSRAATKASLKSISRKTTSSTPPSLYKMPASLCARGDKPDTYAWVSRTQLSPLQYYYKSNKLCVSLIEQISSSSLLSLSSKTGEVSAQNDQQSPTDSKKNSSSNPQKIEAFRKVTLCFEILIQAGARIELQALDALIASPDRIQLLTMLLDHPACISPEKGTQSWAPSWIIELQAKIISLTSPASYFDLLETLYSHPSTKNMICTCFIHRSTGDSLLHRLCANVLPAGERFGTLDSLYFALQSRLLEELQSPLLSQATSENPLTIINPEWLVFRPDRSLSLTDHQESQEFVSPLLSSDNFSFHLDFSADAEEEIIRKICHIQEFFCLKNTENKDCFSLALQHRIDLTLWLLPFCFRSIDSLEACISSLRTECKISNVSFFVSELKSNHCFERHLHMINSDDKFHDVIIALEGPPSDNDNNRISDRDVVQIPCHKIFLSKNDYFASLWRSPAWIDSTRNQIELFDQPTKGFLVFLYYLYSGGIPKFSNRSNYTISCPNFSISFDSYAEFWTESYVVADRFCDDDMKLLLLSDLESELKLSSPLPLWLDILDVAVKFHISKLSKWLCNRIIYRIPLPTPGTFQLQISYESLLMLIESALSCGRK